MGILNDKVALVTGGARGFGAADAHALSKEGAQVIIADLLDGTEVAEECGGLYLKHDVSSEASWAEIIKTIENRFGRLDVLVNNAAICINGNVETTDILSMRKIFSVNVEGVMLGVKYSLPLLKDNGGGSIINIASTSIQRYVPDLLSYAASKGAVAAMCTAITGYCRQMGYPVRCNTVHPGGIDTPMVAQRVAELDPEHRPNLEGILGLPEEYAHVIVFLASDASRYVNGAQMIVDRGDYLL